jgi:hypothetical protein
MKSIRQSNTSKKIVPKSVEQEYYLDMFTLRMSPVSNDYLLHFAKEWVDWAVQSDDALTLEGFYVLKRVHDYTVNRWMKRCPELQQAHDWAMMAIGDRREKGAITRKYDSGMIRTTMPMYKAKWKELEEWRAHLSEKIASAGGLKVVELEKFADSDLVPKKDKRDSK